MKNEPTLVVFSLSIFLVVEVISNNRNGYLLFVMTLFVNLYTPSLISATQELKQVAIDSSSHYSFESNSSDVRRLCLKLSARHSLNERVVKFA